MSVCVHVCVCAWKLGAAMISERRRGRKMGGNHRPTERGWLALFFGGDGLVWGRSLVSPCKFIVKVNLMNYEAGKAKQSLLCSRRGMVRYTPVSLQMGFSAEETPTA